MGRRRSRQHRSTAVRGSAEDLSTPPVGRLIPWSERMRTILVALRRDARRRRGVAFEAWVDERLGDGAAARRGSDVDRLLDDWIVAPGSAGDGRSIAAAHAAEAPDLESIERDQLRRWERERRRGVFIVQRATRDSLAVWDPLEGAPLTLHLLERLAAERAAGLARGAVVTASFQPWIARLVAVGPVEVFEAHDALDLFRREVLAAGRPWHEAPPPAPVRTT